MRTTRPALLAALLAIGPALPGAAQQPQQRPFVRPAPRPPEPKLPEKPAEAPDTPTPYDRDLLRLSEVIGALAFLRELCAAPDAREWPVRMKAILDTEGANASRRDRLAGAYNRGYRGYALTYRGCTASASEASARFLAEGEKLSHGIAGRFGG